MFGNHADAALDLAAALRRLGGQDIREGVLASQLLSLGRHRPVQGFDGIGDMVIRVHAYRGEADRALALLADAVDGGFRGIYGSRGELPRQYDPLLTDPRFLALKARIDQDLAAMGARARQWIADGTDLMGPAPTQLAPLVTASPVSP